MTDHYNNLVKLAARAFYDDLPAKGENQPKTGRSDNRGIGCCDSRRAHEDDGDDDDIDWEEG